MNIFQLIQSCKDKSESLQSIIPIKLNQIRIDEIDSIISSPEIWNDAKKASSLMKERQKLIDIIYKLNYFSEQSNFYSEYSLLENEKIDNEDLPNILSLHKEIVDFEFKQMMSGPNDTSPVILTINSGAGGLESANWVTMLLRMYCRYADSMGFKTEILDMKSSDENPSICTDSVSLRIEGKFAYGFLKSEDGIHRLIRNSPFSSKDARHTSFAAVSVIPDIEDVIDIKINDKDILITAQAAGGPGGQNVNAVNSACRIKHFPTGINILVRSERDFHKNKSTALKMLKAKLYNIEVEKKQEAQNIINGNMSDNAFGYQIRSYILSPSQLIKDHRTGYETNQSSSILDGNIQNFIDAYLKHKSK